ncbi:MAG: arylsulfatase [Planctomycetes bacterium]|nr:arylsulfatase [Planctomycetota bacterium]
MQGILRRVLPIAVAVLVALSMQPASAQPKGKKPNILLIMSDDVGVANISAYSMGLVGYRTPNIDRIARGGMLFTDYYGEQSCTAGRSAFITGIHPVRTGLTKVGLPGSPIGISAKDPTLAELLKPHGYVSGQFGKNHLGDRNEFLPTVHGFDEFYGNLYHLNAEEEPENEDYPKDPAFRATFGPRGVLDTKASDTDDPAVDPRFGRVGKQTVADTGPLTRKRMETADEEFLDRTKKFIRKHTAAGKPWMTWVNTSRMHFYTHLKPESTGVTGLGVYADGMMEHDAHVGQLLDLLDELKISDDTIVVYTCDNGPHFNEWPDGGNTPFRSEKNSNWEGAYRVSGLVRWPGRIKAGTVSNEIMSHLDWVPTLLAAVGEPDVKEKLRAGHRIGDTTYKAHLDGYDFLPYLTGAATAGPRKEFFYFSDDGQLVALRRDQWKMVFAEQRARQLQVWTEPFVSLRAPKLFNLRTDPYERADTDSNNYNRWYLQRAWVAVPTQAIVANFLKSFAEFPMRQKPAKFNVDDVMKLMSEGQTN